MGCAVRDSEAVLSRLAPWRHASNRVAAAIRAEQRAEEIALAKDIEAAIIAVASDARHVAGPRPIAALGRISTNVAMVASRISSYSARQLGYTGEDDGTK